MKRNKVIAITDCSKYANYERWILGAPDVEVIRIGHSLNNLHDLDRADGILLTGGEDIHPKRYHQPELLKYCEQEDMDDLRDELEWNVLAYAEQHQIPLLGICRGLQLGNVFYGGTLIPDMPSFGKEDHAKVQGADRYHGVRVKPLSLLEKATGAASGEVNSAHHQCIDVVGNGLVVNAVSTDGIMEGLEKTAKHSPFFLLVQWHPERMKEMDSPFSLGIRTAFLQGVKLRQS